MLLFAWASETRLCAQGSESLKEKTLGWLHEKVVPWDRLEEDKHPELPSLLDILTDTSICTQIQCPVYKHWNPILLKSGLVIGIEAGLFVIQTLDGKLISKIPTSNDHNTLYVDSLGNIYANDRLYLQPDYTRSNPFPLLEVHRTLEIFESECRADFGEGDPKLLACYREKALETLEWHGLPSSFTDSLHSKSCIKAILPYRSMLVADWGYQLINCNFAAEPIPIRHFDEPAIFHLVKNPLFRDRHRYHIYYMELPNGVRFKEMIYTPVLYHINGGYYLLSESRIYRI